MKLEFRRALVVLLFGFVIMLVASPSRAQSGTGIAGCVTADNAPVPRVTIHIRRGEQLFNLETDEQGCYKLEPVAPGVYRVTARLQGFDNSTRANVRVVAGRPQRVDLALRISPMCECISEPRTLEGLFQNSDAVVRVRIREGIEQVSPYSISYFKHTAEVLEVLKAHRVGGPPNPATPALHEQLRKDPGRVRVQTFVSVLQDQSNGAPDPYFEGDELVLFLRWSDMQRAFWVRRIEIVPHGLQEVAFVINDRRVIQSPEWLGQYEGADVEKLLSDLRSLRSAR